MKSLLTISFLLVLIQTNAQSIVAGEYTSSDYYYNYDPAHVLYAPYPVNTSTDSLFIDMNNDGTDDVVIVVFNNNGYQWFSILQAQVIPINNCAVALGTMDTCFANIPPTDVVSVEKIAHAFDEADVIDGASNWSDSAAYLSFTRTYAAIPNGYGYACSGGEFDLDHRYIGVKVASGNDTLYGWIKAELLSIAGGDLEFSIGSFACNQQAAGIEEFALPKKRLVRIVDVLGRVSEDKPNTVLIRQYSDGTCERVFRFE